MKTKMLHALLMLSLLASGARGMIYRPREVHLWDTWGVYHKGTYYLYYLVATKWEGWDGFGLATSSDGVHWREAGEIVTKRDDAAWMGSGSVWKSSNFAQDGKFICNFSEQPPGEPQHIYFAESTDLLHWTRLAKDSAPRPLDVSLRQKRVGEFFQDPRWYVENGRWDCICTTPRPGGGLYGYWTATPRDFVGFGFGESLDGLHWSALPPPILDWAGHKVPESCEIGGVEKIGGQYYAMVGKCGFGDGRMMTFVSSCPQGPFRASKKNFDLLTGNCYFARFFPTPEGVLVTHQSITHDSYKQKGVCYAAPLKRALIDAEGTLRLGYWRGNEALKGKKTCVKIAGGARSGSALVELDRRFDAARGAVLEGEIELPTANNDGHPGLFIEAEGTSGAAVRLAPGGIVEGGTMAPDGQNFSGQYRADRQTSLGKKARFRLLVRHGMLEFYLDDLLMQVYSLPARATGRIALLEGGRAVTNLSAWTMNLPAAINERTPPMQ